MRLSPTLEVRRTFSALVSQLFQNLKDFDPKQTFKDLGLIR